MEIRALFGKRLRTLRMRNGMTQDGLGRIALLSAVAISNIERGVCAPAFWRLTGLARALRVDVYELFVFDREIQQ
ncbi:MAG: helix-turn-helix domain-containing protein [Proteobacteria bacterium]|nr:helix-turn-helix domain-containing protein [Pseudomonadota bacterium]